jgi:hypothetical protein
MHAANTIMTANATALERPGRRSFPPFRIRRAS